MNEAFGYDPSHRAIAIAGAIDASSQGWGVVVLSVSYPRRKYFARLQTYPLDFFRAHINIKESLAFLEVLRLSVDGQTGYRR